MYYVQLKEGKTASCQRQVYFVQLKIAFGLFSAHWSLFNCTKCNKLWFGHKNIHFSCTEYS